MSVRLTLIAFAVTTMASLSGSQAASEGFGGLGSAAEGFSVPRPGLLFRFPADHGPHPDFRIEWWYLTANLEAPDGTQYGAQWTLFRSALAPGEANAWSSPQLWMGHAAVTTSEDHFVAERISRGGVGQAGVVAAPFSAWIDDWQMKGHAAPGVDQLADLSLTATTEEFCYELRLSATGPLVPQGDNGYSVKSAKGQASYYYSQPFYAVTGSLSLPTGNVEVAGKAWLDREWSSQPLAEDQTGWDWFSLHLDTGEKLMGFRLRDEGEGYTSATWITADGRPDPLPAAALKIVPVRTAKVAGRQIPVSWNVQIPSRGFDVTTQPLNDHAWMSTSIPYWEGPIAFEGSVSGRGYLEMTGY
ncbi:lipocalin-like domain-containing protein [Sinorhizobium sp. GL28]|uniref:lipocalin-like domain-containing protein n=1 Tax=Sinorhizobium sp. GL28 TaxID=1358418 RepID=UPI00071D487E|nr:lipocalin-like domain-containing protein [Sinorhizobium sp. GL28]KSV88534.1 iron ABC transporter permease [Sinorhizobium sp. GL28]